MKITICGSLKFVREMKEIKEKLESSGHQVEMPKEITGTNYNNKSVTEGSENIHKHDLIKKHYNKIVDSDAILVINKDKNGIVNYIGGNSFLEMGFAHVLNKKIFTLNPLPTGLNYEEELLGLQPVILDSDLNLIR